MENYEKYIADTTNVISSNNEKIIQLQKEIETLVQENQHFLKRIMETTKDKTTLQTISAEIPKTKPMTFFLKVINHTILTYKYINHSIITYYE